MVHKMKLKEAPFNAIKIGYKTIELRLFDEKRQKLKVNDQIEFSRLDAPEEHIIKQITALHIFDSFEELYSKLPLLKCGYTPFTLHEASHLDMEQFYSLENQLSNKVIGIELEEEPFQKYLAGHTGAIPDCSGYTTALNEIQNGLKTSHWMWYVFPQIKGLTSDRVTEYYALESLESAREYYEHPILGARLREITLALLQLDLNDPVAIFGTIDAFKLRACMTLFRKAAPGDNIFQQVIDKYCMSIEDEKTLSLIV